MAVMRHLTHKQMKAIALVSTDPLMGGQEAMIKAGYSKATARNAKQQLFNKPSVKPWLENYRDVIRKAGLTQFAVASKLNELLNAHDPIYNSKGQLIAETPNYRIQLETIKVYHDIQSVKDQNTPQGLTKRITLETFEEQEGILEGVEDTSTSNQTT